MNCPRCQKHHSVATNFCNGCGAPMGATTTREQTTIMQEPGTYQATPPPQAVEPPPPVNNDRTSTYAPGGSQPSIVRALAAAPSSGQGPRQQIVLVLDKSGSMGDRYDKDRDKITAAKRGSVSMSLNLWMIEPNDQIGLVAFDSQASCLMELGPEHSHKNRLMTAIGSIQAGGGTDQNEGLKAARDLFDWNQSSLSRRIIMLTDGQGGEPLMTAEDLKSRGVIIEVIGIGDRPSNINEKLLRKVASTINGENRYRFIKDAQTLVDKMTQLGGRL